MKRPIRILLSGPGLIGRKHARLILDCPDAELVGLVAPPIPENQQFAMDMGVSVWESLAGGLQASGAEAVIISAPNRFHFEQAMVCIERGIPVLVEKPVTDKLEDARRLAERAESSCVPLLVGHHRTYSPTLEAADAFMQSNAFGRLVAMQGSAMFYKPAHYFVDGVWRTKLGGGPILINLIHEIGLMRHFCGEIQSIFAMASNAIRSYEVEDTVSMSIQFSNGALGSFVLTDAAASSKSWEMTSGENPAYPHFADEYCYHFAGTRGSLDFPSMQVRTYPEGVDPSWWTPFQVDRLAFQRADPLARQLDHFVSVVRGEAKPRVSARDGFVNMLVVEAIVESVRKRSVVELATASA